MKKLTIILLLSTAFLVSHKPIEGYLYANFVSEDGGVTLVAYYPFNGNANDESGNGYHLTNVGATLTDDRNSNPNSAYNFSGSGQYMYIAQQILNLNNDFTIVVWAMGSGVAANDRLIMLHKFSDLSAYTTLIAGGSTSLRGYLRGGDGTFISSYFSPGINNWHMYTIVKTSSSFDIYVDDQYENTTNITGTFNDNDYLSIGGLYYSGGSLQFWPGIIDDIRIYDEALTSDNITDLYNYTP